MRVITAKIDEIHYNIYYDEKCLSLDILYRLSNELENFAMIINKNGKKYKINAEIDIDLINDI